MKITNRNMVVTAHKEPCDENHPYATINTEAMRKAAQNLNRGAFKLWMYFAKTPRVAAWYCLWMMPLIGDSKQNLFMRQWMS